MLKLLVSLEGLLFRSYTGLLAENMALRLSLPKTSSGVIRAAYSIIRSIIVRSQSYVELLRRLPVNRARPSLDPTFAASDRICSNDRRRSPDMTALVDGR